MKSIILKIGGMTCTACSNSLEKYLNKKEDIIKANVNLVLEEAYIEYNDNLNVEDIEKYIKETGFKSLGIPKNVKDNKSKVLLIIYSVLAAILLTFSMIFMFVKNKEDYSIIVPLIQIILVVPFLVYGIDIFTSGIKSTIKLHPNMNSLVTLGVTTCFIYSLIEYILILNGEKGYINTIYFESSAIVIYFIKLGRYIDNIGKTKTKKVITNLMEITPKKAIILRNDIEVEVDIDEINVDDLVILKPGMKASVDGIIIKGESHFDEAFLTGEARSKKKHINDTVLAGSINLDGYITYKATKIGKDSTISEIVNMVKEAMMSKAKISNLADKISTIFVPMVFLIAVLGFIFYFIVTKSFNRSIIKFATVLVVACPCALGLATPLALVVAHGKYASLGILIKNNQILEEIPNINYICLDKTGTLTYGNYRVFKLFNYSNYSDKELLNIVSNIEANSNHPIKNAFEVVDKIDTFDFKVIDGIGVAARLNDNNYVLCNNKYFSEIKENEDYNYLVSESATAIYIIENDNIIGLIGLKDIIKDNSKELIKELKNRNIEVCLLTGDNNIVASNIANELGITNVISDVYPSDKGKVVNELKEKGYHVMMIGDGINDAVSLANANIGVSVNKNCDIASDSSDIIMMNNELSNLLNIFNISNKTIRIIKENLFWAFFYNLLMIPIALGALESIGIMMMPMWASLAMMISSLTVILNSLRIRR